MRRFVFFALLAVAATVQAVEIGQPFTVPSDPNGRYTVISLDGTLKSRFIVTKRDGKSGVSFAKREYNCDTQDFRYVGKGETLESATAKPKAIGKFSGVTEGSTSASIGGVACAGMFRKLTSAK